MPSEPYARAGNILCCLCGVSIAPNPTAMCPSCVSQEFDITSSIPRTGTTVQCRKCGRWETSKSQWVHCERESAELLSLCLRRSGALGRKSGRGNVRLVDAGWIWTEPHSRRLKVWLLVQGEVDSGATIRQKVIVEFTERSRQCDDCSREFTGGTWKALVQLRQRTDHKRTMLYLEQRILYAGLDRLCLDIGAVKGGGVDFYFKEKSHANAFVDFIGQSVPQRIRSSKKLVGFDTRSNVARHRYTVLCDIAPTCKHDLILLPKHRTQTLESPLLLVKRVGSGVRLRSPVNGAEMDLSSEAYWRRPPPTILSARSLVEFIILDIELADRANEGRPGLFPAEAMVARASDLGTNDEYCSVRTHLGGLLQPGDTALGYDLARTVVPDAVREDIARAFGRHEAPEIVLVRRKRDRTRSPKDVALRRFGDDFAAAAEEPAGAKGPKKRRDGHRELDVIGATRSDVEGFVEQVMEDEELQRLIGMGGEGDEAVARAREAVGAIERGGGGEEGEREEREEHAEHTELLEEAEALAEDMGV